MKIPFEKGVLSAADIAKQMQFQNWNSIVTTEITPNDTCETVIKKIANTNRFEFCYDEKKQLRWLKHLPEFKMEISDIEAVATAYSFITVERKQDVTMEMDCDLPEMSENTSSIDFQLSKEELEEFLLTSCDDNNYFEESAICAEFTTNCVPAKIQVKTKGHVPLCKSCKGTGLQICSTCGGTGYRKCGRCKGTGSVISTESRLVSSERGYKEGAWRESNVYAQDRVQCPVCCGRGEVVCNECNGQKSFPCQDCYGTGRKDGAKSAAEITTLNEEYDKSSGVYLQLEGYAMQTDMFSSLLSKEDIQAIYTNEGDGKPKVFLYETNGDNAAKEINKTLLAQLDNVKNAVYLTGIALKSYDVKGIKHIKITYNNEEVDFYIIGNLVICFNSIPEMTKMEELFKTYRKKI